MNRLDLLLQLALDEDLGHGDLTTNSIVDPDARGVATVFGREGFVLSGTQAFGRVFQLIDPTVHVDALYRDGDEVSPEASVFRVEGKMRGLLSSERTALNLLQRLCGIATATRRMVNTISGTSCRLVDTRKTTPLWRSLEKDAVRHGGGSNHRFGLFDGILIKDNHIAAAGGVGDALRRARRDAPHMLKIEVEVENLEQLREALEENPDIILLDNFSVEKLKDAVAIAKGRCILEASGGVNIDTVRAIAETGVDIISCGALTHSAKAIDLSMEIVSE